MLVEHQSEKQRSWVGFFLYFPYLILDTYEYLIHLTLTFPMYFFNEGINNRKCYFLKT